MFEGVEVVKKAFVEACRPIKDYRAGKIMDDFFNDPGTERRIKRSSFIIRLGLESLRRQNPLLENDCRNGRPPCT